MHIFSDKMECKTCGKLLLDSIKVSELHIANTPWDNIRTYITRDNRIIEPCCINTYLTSHILYTSGQERHTSFTEQLHKHGENDIMHKQE